MIEAGCDWIDILFNGGGIATGVIAGIVAALVQLLISRLEHQFIRETRQEDQEREQRKRQEDQERVQRMWLRDEIGKLIREVTAIKVPAKTVTDDDVIDNAYHLIDSDYERSKPLLYKIKDDVTMSEDFDILHSRYELLQKVRLGHGEETKISKLKKDLIEEMGRSKNILLKNLQRKEKEVISKL